jgi:hypothetical protein
LVKEATSIIMLNKECGYKGESGEFCKQSSSHLKKYRNNNNKNPQSKMTVIN